MRYICSFISYRCKAFLCLFFVFSFRQNWCKVVSWETFQRRWMREKVQLLLSVVSLFPKCPFHGFPSQARARGASETLNDPSQAAVTRWGWCAVNGKLDFSLWSAIKAQPEGVLEKLANKYGGLGVKRAQTICGFFFLREKHEQTHRWETTPRRAGKENQPTKVRF